MRATDGEMAGKCPECLGEFLFSHFDSYRGNKPVYVNTHGIRIEYSVDVVGLWSISSNSLSYHGFLSLGFLLDCPVDVKKWNRPPGVVVVPIIVTCT